MKVGEHKGSREAHEGCGCEQPVAMMITHERPGFLLATVNSFRMTAPDVRLHVFDDGSHTESKIAELEMVRRMGAVVIRLPHSGFANTWERAFDFARRSLVGYDSVIMLEDDIVFAKGWLDVLKRMQRAIPERGLKQDMTSCFRPHMELPSESVSLGGVEAYASMAHSFQVNMMPFEVLNRMDVIEESVREANESNRGLGLDVYLVGNLAHRLHRTSFVSTASWVGHMGACCTVVGKQGWGACKHAGVNLVDELKSLEEPFVDARV